MAKPITDEEFRWFSEWIVEEFGLVFGPARRDILRARLEPRRTELGFDTFEQLYFHLKYHPDRENEREKIIPYLTNNESYFFRESAQLDVLRSEVLGTLSDKARREKRRNIRILSAGCASGEEAYTLSMIADGSFGLTAGEVTVTGLDLDPEALARARNAVYGPNAFRRSGPELKEKYFTPLGKDLWTPIPRIRQMAKFERANLATGDWVNRIPQHDVIFCRNVLIYFGELTIRFAAETFYDALRPGGYLFLGHSETLSRTPTRFQTVRRPGCIFYQKPDVAVG